VAKKASSRKRAPAKRRPPAKAAPGKATAKSVKKAAKKTLKKAPKRSTGKAGARPGVSPPRKRTSAKSALGRAQMKTFHGMLLAKRRELVGDMTGIEAEAFGSDRQEVKGDISDHPADAGTDNFEQEFSLELLESERTLLAQIDEALGRIENRTYGVCLGTGKPISKARLKARPWAKYGIEYARMIEKGLVRPGERLDDDEE